MLDLSGTRITDAGLAHLKGLSRLWDLDLRGTQVSRGGVLELQLASPTGIAHVQFRRENGAPPAVELEKTSASGDAGP